MARYVSKAGTRNLTCDRLATCTRKFANWIGSGQGRAKGYTIGAARLKEGNRPGSAFAAILKEDNVQIRAVKIQAYGIDRYFLDAGAQTIDTSGEYSLLRIGLDHTRELVCLKMVCPVNWRGLYFSSPTGSQNS
jgi:hypothetical protein